MHNRTVSQGRGEPRDRKEGCAYPLDSAAGNGSCGAPVRLRSSYCAHHHALCHVPRGTRAEACRLREAEVLARVVGGRRGSSATAPSKQFLDRLEHAVRDFF